MSPAVIDKVHTIIDTLPDVVIDKVIDLVNDPVVDKVIAAVPKIPVKVPVKPSTPSTQTGLTWPQATAMAAAFSTPALANVFYYGKDFGSKKQKVGKKGELEQEDYKELSVTKAGAQGEQIEELAQSKKNDENGADDLLSRITRGDDNTASSEEIEDIVRKGA